MASCPPGWRERESRNRCQNPDITYRDPLFDAPVTSARTNITYSNSYCASCNNDFDPTRDEVWPLEFKCNLQYASLNTTTLLQRLEYDSIRLSWVLNLTGIDGYLFHPFSEPLIISDYTADESIPHGDAHSTDKLYRCSAAPLTPTLTHNLRYCSHDIVNECAENWKDTKAKTDCEAYTAHICFGHKTYRNYHCIKCNNVKSSEIQNCVVHERRLYAIPVFSVLLDWCDVKRQHPCNGTQVYDPLSRSCRNTQLPERGEY